MKTYAISPVSKLVFSVDSEPWEAVTFQKGDFDDPGNATAEELAKVLGTQLAKACEGLAISDEDAATRQKLEEDYPNAK